MDPRRVAVFALALGIVAGCGSVTPSPTSAAVASAPGSHASSPPTEPEVVATIDPGWITRPALTCGERDHLFPPEALEGLGLAELGSDAAAQILRTVLTEGGSESMFPQSGWHRVIDRPDGATFIAKGDVETPWWVVTVGDLGGTLQATGYGECHLSVAPPGGVTLAQWWLDPDGPGVTPTTTKVAVLLRERACAGGRSPEGRVMAPTIVATTESIVIAIGVWERPGANDCPGNPQFAHELELPEPIGSRGLFDASEFPPRPVTSDDPG